METLPVISDVLEFVCAFYRLNVPSSRNPSAEAVASAVLNFLAALISDVHDALEKKYMGKNSDL